VALSDGQGRVSEGPGFNIFSVRGGTVTTPETGVLEGITRRTVLEICDELRIAAEPKGLTQSDLRAADEVFISSTAGGVMPVCRIDGEPIGEGVPGPVTGRITELYWRKHEDPRWTTPVD
jgi:branched-chain amino acid aminotransferase